MKINLSTLGLVAAVLASGAIVTSCDDSDDITLKSFYRDIDFENSTVLAGPTSYGANLYSTYTEGPRFTTARYHVEATTYLEIGLGTQPFMPGQADLYNGGIFPSQWNIRSGENWDTYLNQCSVYNTASAEGTNKGAGTGGSNTFAVVNGFGDTAPSMSFTDGAVYEIESIDICPTSYVYGVITQGNPYGMEPDKNLEQQKGWFKILAYGYDAQGNATNGGKPVEYYIADYRDGSKTKTAIASTWKTWNIAALGKVNKIKFDFDGSDKGTYGLNTPAYAAIDNIHIHMGDAE